ncbi:hypothetical protein KIN20_005170 [Parelaphostrongylus tenuis]|uniref:Uncharacterized protein n=1 Tax=Parelaphostrongylus tenuis TaxID=148309 RepID=A0AAD5MKZ7_PARTN|nr:hypothetical protein KIN20_005170 [Parelaphostrongylus tenuis]
MKKPLSKRSKLLPFYHVEFLSVFAEARSNLKTRCRPSRYNDIYVIIVRVCKCPSRNDLQSYFGTEINANGERVARVVLVKSEEESEEVTEINWRP